MEFLAEDMGRVAKLCVTRNEVMFHRCTPQSYGNVEVAIVGKAKVVVVYGDNLVLSVEQLMEAIRDAWVLVINGEVSEELVKVVHPYMIIFNGLSQSEKYEEFSRGWNVENEVGEYAHRKMLNVGKSEKIEVLFGESRENPVGLLSIKIVKMNNCKSV